MAKVLYVAEKPSVAREFAQALGEDLRSQDGYMESEGAVVTWCVGHLVTMSYPEAYDEKYKRWSLETLPFIPREWRYEIIDSAKKQFKIVSGLLNRKDVDTIYICTDSGREGEYIYRLVDQMAHVEGKTRKRVWIDSQTREEILRGIREAKDWSAYDNLSASAYLRAKEDYLMGINFSRLLTLKYGNTIANFLKERRVVVSVGRVMTCVLGMVVRREREIRAFQKTPFYRVFAELTLEGETFGAEWRVAPGSRYDTGRWPDPGGKKGEGKKEEKAEFSAWGHPKLYKENGFKERADAEALIAELAAADPQEAVAAKVERKKEKKNPPLLYNLAELQNDCAKLLKISPDETLKVVQELYEKKLVTYPRTDARVLSTAVAKEIGKNLAGLQQIPGVAPLVKEILADGSYKTIANTRYTNDRMITDHYAVIPTGQGMSAAKGLSRLQANVYEAIVRRFLAIFLDPAVYRRVSLDAQMDGEHFFSSIKVLEEEGYLRAMQYSFRAERGPGDADQAGGAGSPAADGEGGPYREGAFGEALLERIGKLKKGAKIPVAGFAIREGETSPPKRYNSGSMILAMENAGQLIEDEDLRAQIKGSGIGTSATRAEILNKLVRNKYLSLNKKTQIITPTLLGEMIFDVVNGSIRSLLNPELTASWEKGLSYVADGSVTSEEYMQKLDAFVTRHTDAVKGLDNQVQMREAFARDAAFYRTKTGGAPAASGSPRGTGAARGKTTAAARK